MIEIKNENITNLQSDLSLLVVSCDKYKDLWAPFFRCFFKYWPDCPYPIFLGSNETEYSHNKVKSILVGPDIDYSTNLLSMLAKIESQWLILWIEDLLLCSTVNTTKLSYLINLAKTKQVGYLKLSANTPWAFTKNRNQEIGPIPKGVKYRATIGLSLWKKDVLFKLLEAGESAWQIERNGTTRSNSFVDPFYCFTPKIRHNPPLSYVNCVIKGSWNRDAVPFFRKENLEECIPNRTIQSLWSYLYAKIYLLRLDFYRRIGKYWYE